MNILKYATALGAVSMMTLSGAVADARPSDDVAVGYGRAAEKDLTSSVSSISADRLDARSSAFDVLQALAGQVAGVNIISGSGMPGTLGYITVRGNGSMSSSVKPLFVVDGAIDVDPSSIIVADIETIQVLKDAAATAIYGVKGANGVVVITTKKGHGNGTVSFDTKTGAGFLMSAPGLTGTDWYKDCTRSAIVTNNNLTFSKGDETTNLYANVGYQDNQGIVNGTGADRLNGTLNISSRINNWYEVQASASASVTNRKAGAWESYALGAGSSSPLTELEARKDDTRSVKTNFNLINTVKILKGLTLTVTGNYQTVSDVDNVTAGMALKDIDAEAPFAKIFNAKTSRLTNEDYLTYGGIFADGRLRSEYVLGATVNSMRYEDSFTGSHNLPTDYYGYHNIGLGTAYSPTSSRIADDLYSGWFRTTQIWRGKYAFGLSFRADKSSVLGESHRTGIYPSVSAGWTISEEPFFASAKPAVDFLKLRVSYGTSGNAVFATSLLKALAGNDLSAETSRQFDAGIEAGFAGGRVKATVDWYLRNSTDLVIESAGSWGNLGELRNSGVEITVNARIIDTKDFKWNTDLVFSTYSTKVRKLGGATVGDALFNSEEGQAWRRFYLASGTGDAYFGQAAPKCEASLVNTFSVCGLDVLLDINSMFGHKAFLVPHGFSASRGAEDNLSNAGFARLRTFAVSYDLKRSVLKNFRLVKGLRIGVTAENLFVLTDYSGNDPEVFSAFDGLAGLGVDYCAYPKPATVTGNLRISF